MYKDKLTDDQKLKTPNFEKLDNQDLVEVENENDDREELRYMQDQYQKVAMVNVQLIK